MTYKIYAIICNITDEVYFGSTSNFKKRISAHKNCRCNSSKQIVERGDYRVEVLEEDDYTKAEAREREDFYYQNFECVNKYAPAVPGRTQKQWDEINRKKKITCECGLVISNYHKAQHKRTKKHQLLIQIKK